MKILSQQENKFLHPADRHRDKYNRLIAKKNNGVLIPLLHKDHFPECWFEVSSVG